MSAEQNAMIQAVGQIAIAVHDPERAKTFYRDVLGLTLLFEAGELSFFQVGGVRLMLTRPSHEELAPPGSILYYKVADLDAAFASISSSGAQVEQTPHLVARMPSHELWMAALRDPEGNYFELMCERPAAA